MIALAGWSGLFCSTVCCYKIRALAASPFQPKPSLLETAKASVPVVAPYFIADDVGSYNFRGILLMCVHLANTTIPFDVSIYETICRPGTWLSGCSIPETAYSFHCNYSQYLRLSVEVHLLLCCWMWGDHMTPALFRRNCWVGHSDFALLLQR